MTSCLTNGLSGWGIPFKEWLNSTMTWNLKSYDMDSNATGTDIERHYRRHEVHKIHDNMWNGGAER